MVSDLNLMPQPSQTKWLAGTPGKTRVGGGSWSRSCGLTSFSSFKMASLLFGDIMVPWFDPGLL